MDFANLTQYVNYLRLGILALVALVAVIGAIRRSRPRAGRRDLLQGIVAVIAVGAMGAVASATSWPYVGVLFAVGLGIGLILGGVRPLVAWIGALAAIYFTMALLWDQGGSFAPGLAVLALSAGAALGQGVRGKMRAGGAPDPGVARPAV